MFEITEKKEVTFKLDEIPAKGCVIKDNYVVCKSETGDVRVAKVEGPLDPKDVEKWVTGQKD